MIQCNEWNCAIGDQTLRGAACLPAAQGRMPAMICSHGYGNTHEEMLPYGKAAAEHGMAAFMVDFRGGGMRSTSDGATTDMSVFTEANDLCAVVDAVKNAPNVDPDRIVLLGASQGGFVSAVTAARIPESVAALILLYPAFVLIDDMHEVFGSLDKVPNEIFYREIMLLGHTYFKEVWDYDPYKEIGTYRGPVLILHGTADPIVPLTYAERAADVYGNVTLEIFQGAGHGFEGDDFSRCLDNVFRFLADADILSPGSSSQKQSPRRL